jgi:Tfp pilus assembly protein PilF
MTQHKHKSLIVMAVLTIIVLVVFWQVHSFEFLNYDDDKYVSENIHIRTGFAWQNIKWVFTNEHASNWHPLTGLSHILDCQLFGPRPGLHHLVNLLFHIINTLLLFVVLRKMTAAFWQSAFVAALFALHPLHVESVAWISERKDVLSTCFWILTMAAYFSYVQKPNTVRYVFVLVLFALGLMAKPMLVTLPFVLLLLDYWPLNRLDSVDGRQFYHLVREKIPFLILSAVSSVITFIVQKNAGAVQQFEVLPLAVRAPNAVVSYAKYILKMIWPTRLAVFYPHPGEKLPLGQVLMAAVSLVIITIFVIRFTKKYKYLSVGWFWYLGTLIPVIGLVQVGGQAMADRYTYIPFIGLFIIVAWGTNDLLIRWKYRKIALEISAMASILVLSLLTGIQTAYWRNSETLFEHTLKVTNENYVAHNNLALALSQHDKFDEALNHLYTALRINPNFFDAYNNLGMVYIKLDRCPEAIQACLQAIRINPANPLPYSNLGVIYLRTKQYQQAIQNFQKAIRIKPDLDQAHVGLGIAYFETGDKESAMKEYEILRQIEANKTNIPPEPFDKKFISE